MSERLDLLNCEDADDDRMSEFRSVASKLASSCEAYRRELARAYAEIDRLSVELVRADTAAAHLADDLSKLCRRGQITRTRETIDGVDCERIKGVDVIVPVGLIPDGEEPADMRSYCLPCPSRWINNLGQIDGPLNEVEGAACIGDIYLTLRDKPAPAPTATWTPPASMPPGVYTATDKHLRGSDSQRWAHATAHNRWSDYIKPAPGRWQVEQGRATYLGPNQEATT